MTGVRLMVKRRGAAARLAVAAVLAAAVLGAQGVAPAVGSSGSVASAPDVLPALPTVRVTDHFGDAAALLGALGMDPRGEQLRQAGIPHRHAPRAHPASGRSARPSAHGLGVVDSNTIVEHDSRSRRRPFGGFWRSSQQEWSVGQGRTGATFFGCAAMFRPPRAFDRSCRTAR